MFLRGPYFWLNFLFGFKMHASAKNELTGHDWNDWTEIAFKEDGLGLEGNGFHSLKFSFSTDDGNLCHLQFTKSRIPGF